MVNFGLNSASILGIFIAVAGASLYFLRSIRPELSRDHDIFFAAVGLLCGFILLFQGWRLDPILQFGQFLLTGSAIFFAVESIRLRGVATEQARRSTPIVDDERPVSRVYRAELDQIEPYDVDEDQYDNRRLRGSRKAGYNDEPRSARNRSRPDRYSSGQSSRKRRPRPSSPPQRDRYNEWGETSDSWEDRPTTSRKRRPSSESRSTENRSQRSRNRRSRPSDTRIASGRDYSETEPTDYVDYHPIDEQDNDNQDWEKDNNQGRNRDKNRDRERNRNEDNAINFDY